MKFRNILSLAAIAGFCAFGQAYAADDAAVHPQHKMMEKADANSDGKISHDEFRAAHEKRGEEHFKRVDTNGDGSIDKDEREAAHKKMHERRKQHHEKMHEKAEETKTN